MIKPLTEGWRRPTLSEKPAFSVSDVTPRGEEWYFALYGLQVPPAVHFAFRNREEANLSRRLMKEIISWTIASPQHGEGQPPLIPVSWGELIDKITILEIKRDNIQNEDAMRNIRYELSLLELAAAAVFAAGNGIADLKSQLAAVNNKLWQIENSIREKEARREFDAGFVEIARSVYRLNDERSALKRAINTWLKSSIIEQKSYCSTSP